MSSNKVQYSDADLAEFKALIEEKINKSEEQIKSLEEQIKDINESADDDFGTDISDDSSVNDNIAMLDRMTIRQRKHLQDLRNALLRIKNKTYGVCFITGELIDKKRLLAVPTTTKSLAAKEKNASTTVKTEPTKPKPYQPSKSKSSTPKIISKVVKRTKLNPTEQTTPTVEINEEDDDDLLLEDEKFLYDEDMDFLGDEEE